MAIDEIIEASIEHAFATGTGDYKTANQSYFAIKNAADHLKANNELRQLERLLNNNEASIQVWATTPLSIRGKYASRSYFGKHCI